MRRELCWLKMGEGGVVRLVSFQRGKGRKEGVGGCVWGGRGILGGLFWVCFRVYNNYTQFVNTDIQKL